jgi:hypothetical protein
MKVATNRLLILIKAGANRLKYFFNQIWHLKLYQFVFGKLSQLGKKRNSK